MSNNIRNMYIVYADDIIEEVIDDLMREEALI